MTPKEKAIELYNNFNCVKTPSEMNFNGIINLNNLSYLASKHCDLIAVNEIIISHEMAVFCEYIVLGFWKEVKQEIEKL